MFDFICYKHIPDARRRKLDDKIESMILVGYHKIGVYRLFNPINDKIVMSRDIMIDENSVWGWNSCDATNKPLMSYGFDEESGEHILATLHACVLSFEFCLCLLDI